MENDIADSLTGMSLSFWTQGCPHRCKGCHNPETWDFNGGKELPDDYVQKTIDSLRLNGIKRDLSILGGEPLCDQNIDIVFNLIEGVLKVYPDTKIYLWTGYTIDQLIARQDPKIISILNSLYILVDGPFILEQRNTLLPLRGSENQRILYAEDIRDYTAVENGGLSCQKQMQKH